MQTFSPIVLSAPGDAVVQLDLLKVVADRLLVCSNSGGGKSHATRLLIEQAGQQMPVIVIDPEGEWSSVREAIPSMALVGDVAAGADAPADPLLARDVALRLLELGCGAVIELSHLPRDSQARFVRLFLEALLAAPTDVCNQGRPRLVVIDEAHRFCPEGQGDAESRSVVIQLMDSGRKRGLGGVLVTQRFAKVAKSATGEANALLVGRFSSDVDQRRAAEVAGIAARGRSVFGEFEPGEFLAIGEAFGNKGKAVRFRTNPKTRTVHPQPGMQAFARPERSERLAERFSDLRVPIDGEPPERTPSDSRELEELRARLERSEAARIAAEQRCEAVVAQARVAVRELARALDVDVQPGIESVPLKLTDEVHAARTGAKIYTDGRSRDAVAMRKSSRTILSALSMFPAGLSKSRIGTVTGLTPSGGSFNVTLKELRDHAWIEGSDPIKITQAGLDALGDDKIEIPKPGRERAAFWCSRLRSRSAQIIMAAFIELYGRDSRATMSKLEIGQRTGLATTGGSFNTAMKQLRDHGIIVGSKSMRLNPDIMELR